MACHSLRQPRLATVAHVLRLVGSSYLEPPLGLSFSRSSHVVAPLRLQPPVHVSRRFASSAHALADSIHDIHLNARPKLNPPSRRAPPTFEFPCFPIPQWAHIPAEIEAALFVGSPIPPSLFRSTLEDARLNPVVLAVADRLRAVFLTFASAEQKDWVWLVDILGQAKNDISRSQWAEVPGSESLFRGLRGLAYAHAGDWETARANIAIALKAATADAPSQAFYPAYDVDVIEAYIKLVRAAHRIEDVAVAVRYAGKGLQWSLSDPKAMATTRSVPAALRLKRMLYDALNELPSPDQWILSQREPDRSGRPSRAIYHMAAVLLTALANQRARAVDAYAFWRFIVRMFNNTQVPAETIAHIAANLSRKGLQEAARDVLVAMRAYCSFLPHIALSREIWIHARGARVEDAQRVWNEICAREQPSTGDRLALAYAHASKGDHDATMETLVALFGPQEAVSKISTLAFLQLACINAGDTERALHYLEKSTAISPTIEPFEALINMYAKQADVDGAINLFQRMLSIDIKPSPKCYTSLLSLFANRSDYVNADYTFNAMLNAGQHVDATAWSAVINASIEAGKFSAAADWCQKVPLNLVRHAALAGTMLKALVIVAAPLESVLSLFRKIATPSERAWALVIQAAADHDQLSLARSMFEEMDTRSRVNAVEPAPTVYVFSILLAAYLRVGDRNSARAAYDSMVARGIVPSSVTYGIIISSFANAPGESSFEQAHNFAMSVFNQLAPGELTGARGKAADNIIGPLIIAAGRANDMDRVKRYYDIVQESGAGSITLASKLMEAYRRNNMIKPLLRVWFRVFSNAKKSIPRITPAHAADPACPPVRSRNNVLCVPLSITIQALGELGKHSLLKQLWSSVRTAGFGFDSQNYNHYAVALARSGDIEGAFHIVDRVILPRQDELRQRQHQAIRASEGLAPVASEDTVAWMEDVDDTIDNTIADDGIADFDMTNASVDDISKLLVENEAENPSDDDISSLSVDTSETSPKPAMNGPLEDATDNDAIESSDKLIPNLTDNISNHSGDDTLKDGFLSADDVAEPPHRPPNRRHDYHPKTLPPSIEASGGNEGPLGIDLSLLKVWRPADVLWRPSLLTISVLDHAYRQLEDQRAYRAWIGLGADESDPEAEESGVRLPDFGNVTAKDLDGSDKRMSPKLMVARLNRKYTRVVGLIMLHRRKKRDFARRK